MRSVLTFGVVVCAALAPATLVLAQAEGPLLTQALVSVDARSTAPEKASALTVSVNNRKETLTDWQQVVPAKAQVAVLIDGGLRQSIGRELDNLQNFVRGLPPGVEVLVGFMEHGSVVSDQGFTTNHESAASELRMPTGLPGLSASPYLCLSDFVKHWPSGDSSGSTAQPGMISPHKARFVLMITDGVDPYNGSTSVMNQGSTYVDAAVLDAQRAGVAVYALYFGDAGIRGYSADNSGQDYLSQIAQATGGINLWEGIGNPVSMTPYLRRFENEISETYVASFMAPATRSWNEVVHVKFSAAKAKLHAADEVRPGNME